MLKTVTNKLSFKGSLFTMTVLQWRGLPMDAFAEQLREAVQQAPSLFQQMPLILDLQTYETPEIPLDFPCLSQTLRQQGIILVGVRGGNAVQQKMAEMVGLAVFPPDKSGKSQKVVPDAESKSAASVKKSPNKLVTQVVRSGQQIYAAGGDLIITAAVSHGAEVLADGNIHIYAPLRGRALAGVGGDTTARIFCHHFEAELVSIAGHYLLQDKDPMPSVSQKMVQIYLENGRLHFAPLT